MAVADSVSIRAESDTDFDAIHGVVAQAFGGDLEAQLVRNIRASREYVAELALVAIADGQVVGHVMVSHCTLDDDGTSHEIATLSPVSVRPDRQGDGIGSAIIREVIARANARSEPLIVVEGSPLFTRGSVSVRQQSWPSRSIFRTGRHPKPRWRGRSMRTVPTCEDALCTRPRSTT